MQIVRWAVGADIRLGWIRDDGVIDLTAQDPSVRALEPLIQAARWVGARPSELVERLASGAGPAFPWEALRDGDVPGAVLLPPVGEREVWAAGVTYERSRVAREQETQVPDVYERVYGADRPEIFLKAPPGAARGHGAPVGLRADSQWQVPEPELALILDADGRIAGITAGNDMSARDIEGENPLYLPQAKIFDGSCALGPVALLTDDPGGRAVRCRIIRSGSPVFTGESHTGRMRRSYAELVEYLRRHRTLEDGAVLLTGTDIVPPDEFTLEAGDVIEVEIEGVGTLRNTAAAAEA